MKRWNITDMLDIGRKLFAKIHKQKHHVHANHDVHFMARELNDWLVQGIKAMLDGSYTPRYLKRYYFQDEMIDQLHLSDRIFQHILLKQLKPTFPHVMNQNCYHLHGPSGVRLATQRMMAVLKERRLSLSRKKTRIGHIDKGFHFLGIHYLGTQPLNNTNVTQVNVQSVDPGISGHYLASLGGGDNVYN